MSGGGSCRFCHGELVHSLADLGRTPLANRYLSADMLDAPEPTYPLHARVCGHCFLVQVDEEVSANELFDDYAYYSGYSDSWLRHCERFAASAIERFELGPTSLVIELASNDGCLLRCFQQAGVPVLGIEPARNVARAAIAAGIPTQARFFCAETAIELLDQGMVPDLLIGNNVLAHVPDINDFVAGLAHLLPRTGTVSLEFPHLFNLLNGVQFDTIYHEHFSYLSLLTVERIFAAHGLRVFDVEQIPTHGGSLRVFAEPNAGSVRPITAGALEVRRVEKEARLDDLATYSRFAERVTETREGLRSFLEAAKDAGQTVAGYGAAAKGNTLLNTIGATSDLIGYVVDRSPHKQGLFLPGSRIPIHAPERILETRPDYVLILPWNLKDEIIGQMSEVLTWGGRFVTAIPEMRIVA